MVDAQGIAQAPAYFGFYDSNSPGFPDETVATSKIANTVWLGCVNPSACTSALQEARANHMYAIVAFDGGSGRPGLLPPGYTAAQLESWKTSWTAFWSKYLSTVGPYVANGTIAAFYPYDEPFSKEWTAGNQDSQTTGELDFAADVIHGTFKGSKVAMTLTGANTFTYLTHGQNILPSHFDWIGIDLYGCWRYCSDNDKVLTEPYTWYVSTLEKNLYRNQKLILLPGTAVFRRGPYEEFEAGYAAKPDPGWDDEVRSQAQNVQNILSLSLTDHAHIVGEFGFLYQTYKVSQNAQWVGAADPTMKPMLNVVSAFGKNVMKR
jgi:hypothetical protein